jgi:hypothetical protein
MASTRIDDYFHEATQISKAPTRFSPTSLVARAAEVFG